MPYEIAIKKAVLKNLRRLPEEVQERFGHLVFVLRQSGPTGPHIFQNYGKLGKNETIAI